MEFVVAFFSFVLRLFFSQIEVSGVEHVPKKGAVIFVGNHNNQFMDALLLLTLCNREVGFIIAQKSLERPVVGFFARAVRSIGVRRPQDEAWTGTGKLIGSGINIKGLGTRFTKQVAVGQTLAVKGYNETPRVAQIVSDTELILKSPFSDEGFGEDGVPFTVRPELDHSQLFSRVWSRLAEGRCIGIFPEGGSHDRPQLLPLKGGVSLMALGAMDKYDDCQVSIVPCGLSYFQGHRFRSHVFVEFGRPYEIPYELVERYRTNKREACAELLETIEQRLRMVTVNFQDLQTMHAVQTCRRLYQPKDANLTSEQYLELNRRFAEGFEKLKDHEKLKEMLPKLMDYQTELQKQGLKDYQVREIELEDTYAKYVVAVVRVLYLLVLLVASLPGFLINLPIGLILKNLAVREAEASKRKSDVKLEGKDVIASYKVLVGLLVVPAVWAAYSFIVWAVYGWNPIFSWPVLMFFSYSSVRVTEEGILVWKSSVPLLRSLTRKDYRQRIKKLHDTREALKAEVRSTVEELGPLMGAEFWGKRIIQSEEIARESVEHPSPLKIKYNRATYKHRRSDMFDGVLEDVAEELGIKE